MDTAQFKTVRGGRRGGDILAYAQEFGVETVQTTGFIHYVYAWFFAVKEIRAREVLELAGSPDPDVLLRFQQAWSFLISFGERAAKLARENPGQAKLEVLGLTVGCIEAETRLLQENLRIFESGMSSSEADDILNSIG